MKCPVCHRENREDSAYCVYCGAPLERKQKQPKQETHSCSMAVTLILASLFMLVLGYFFHPQEAKKSTAGTYQTGSTVLTVEENGSITFTENKHVYYGVSSSLSSDEAGEINLEDNEGEKKNLTVWFSDSEAEVFERTGNYQAVHMILTKE